MQSRIDVFFDYIKVRILAFAVIDGLFFSLKGHQFSNFVLHVIDEPVGNHNIKSVVNRKKCSNSRNFLDQLKFHLNS